MRFRHACISALACLFLASSAGAQVTLRLKLKVGQKLAYSARTQTMSNGGPAATAGSGATVSMSMLVTAQSGKGWSVTQKVDDLKMDKPTGAAAGMDTSRFAKQIVGQTSTMTVDETGRTSAAKAGLASQMLGQSLSSSLGFMGVVFPSGPVHPGSTWTETLDLTSMFGQFGMSKASITGGKIPVKYTLRSIGTLGSRRIATLDVVMSGQMSIRSAAKSNGPAMSLSTTISNKMTAVIDLATGILQSAESSGTTVTSMNQMRMNQRITSSVRLK